jgi:hypothetical protein
MLKHLQETCENFFASIKLFCFNEQIKILIHEVLIDAAKQVLFCDDHL